MRDGHRLARHLVQQKPEQRRGLRDGEVGAEVAVDVEERLLEDVRRVEPAPDPRVDPKLDHVPEWVALLVEELRPGPPVAAEEPMDRIGPVAVRIVQVVPHTPNPRPPETGTVKSGKKPSEARSKPRPATAPTTTRIERGSGKPRHSIYTSGAHFMHGCGLRDAHEEPRANGTRMS